MRLCERGHEVGSVALVDRTRRRIPEATVARLPVYLRTLAEMRDSQVATVSSERLAEMAGVNAAKVRKDLSYLGTYGTRGVGYDVEYLLFQMSRELGLTHDWPVAIVGMGNLGAALANYGGFGDRGFPVAALVDADRDKVGTFVAGHAIHHLDELPDLVVERAIAIGIVATPASVAQDVADRLVDAGVASILNFAPAVISVEPPALLRKVDLALELQILSFYRQRDGLDASDDGRFAPRPRSGVQRRGVGQRRGLTCPSTSRSTRSTSWWRGDGAWSSAAARSPSRRPPSSCAARPRSTSWRPRSSTISPPSRSPAIGVRTRPVRWPGTAWR